MMNNINILVIILITILIRETRRRLIIVIVAAAANYRLTCSTIHVVNVDDLVILISSPLRQRRSVQLYMNMIISSSSRFRLLGLVEAGELLDQSHEITCLRVDDLGRLGVNDHRLPLLLVVLLVFMGMLLIGHAGRGIIIVGRFLNEIGSLVDLQWGGAVAIHHHHLISTN